MMMHALVVGRTGNGIPRAHCNDQAPACMQCTRNQGAAT